MLGVINNKKGKYTRDMGNEFKLRREELLGGSPSGARGDPGVNQGLIYNRTIRWTSHDVGKVSRGGGRGGEGEKGTCPN